MAQFHGQNDSRTQDDADPGCSVASQGIFVVWSFFANPIRFVSYLGFTTDGNGTLYAWLLAGAGAVAYVWGAASYPAVRQFMFRPTALKVVAVAAAVMAGILEEVVFRKWVMDYLGKTGYGNAIQIIASGVTFGLGHAVWGIKNLAAGLNAILWTSLLGFALGVVYVVGERSLAPCVVAHFVITALVEPGLMLAAVRGQLGWHALRA